ncbi:ankyrin repeat domain-containing protein [Streptomyces sp. TRM66268-LWL]|uniref:Ankyrin repeat domain-containing protein n=1 Tax=Streptomyces polyasparticus TaxID=2767826 RepID=A0ABR7S979_9ACTN|nr:ankyrin repeat domain-containing protein [Streptomyces polyasparticus]MBC9711497.1 ankyrin repeat domain-containing protein [Streptomyces polyasparticus]
MHSAELTGLVDKREYGAALDAIQRPPCRIAAAQGGFDDLVAALIDRGADVNARNDDGASALLEAARNDHGGAVGVLLGAGAEVDSADRWGHTALMVAAGFASVAVLRRLVMAGADPKAQDKRGRSVVNYAIESDNQEAITYLSTLGAGTTRL